MRLLALLLLITSQLGAQSQESTYFQQEVNYNIKVRLDDVNHVLHGDLGIEYFNFSPDTLHYIPFHLWPRAYSGTNTAFARQQLRNGNTRFQFAETQHRGTMDSLDFQVDEQPAPWAYDSVHPDVAIIRLAKPLLPNGHIQVSTPFRVKIPASFSRLGHVGQSYQITQWYPKPAVYDQDGWHVMPYLDRGEFYADFGRFNVAITLPENYVVGATGELQGSATWVDPAVDSADYILSEVERDWLLEKAKNSRTALATRTDLARSYVREPFPESSSNLKTVNYAASSVHDFAWFADKRFRVLHDTVQIRRKKLRTSYHSLGHHFNQYTAGLPQYWKTAEGSKESLETVDIWAFFTETEAAHWQHATEYLKRSVRFYSNHVGAYPYAQMTAVQSALSAGGGMEYPMITVIGRNQTAADLDKVLAHEVGHNWFQGVLASNERDHPWLDEGLNSYYEQRYIDRYYPDRPQLGVLGKEVNQDRLGYHYTSRLGTDQAPATTSDSLGTMNYWITAYSKPALALHQLASHLGTEKVDTAMRAYYERWKFRHPQPADFFSSLEDALGEDYPKNFSDHFLTNKPQSYLPASTTGGRKSIRLEFLTGQEQADQHKLFYAPLLGYNRHDGVMAGLALHNRTLEPRPLEWVLAPLYGFKSQSILGMAGLRYRITHPFSGVRRAEVALGVHGFSDFTLSQTDEAYAYDRTALRFNLVFDHPAISKRHSRAYLQLIRLNQDRPLFDQDPIPVGTEQRTNHFFRLGYTREVRRTLAPLSWSVHLEYKDRDRARNPAFEASHLRLDATLQGGYMYERDKSLNWRFFGGYFLRNQLRESSGSPASAFSLVDNAESDYRYDDLYFGRNAPNGNWAEQQLGYRQGGFRAPIGRAFNFGRSNSYLFALNLDADLPINLQHIPFGLFLDAGYYGTKATTLDPLAGKFSWVGGPSLSFFRGKMGLFLPLVADPDTKDLLEQRGNLLHRLSFRLNLSGGLPWKWMDDLF